MNPTKCLAKCLIALFAPSILAFGLMSCGGGENAPVKYAESLVYTNPTASGYRLVRATSSAPKKLVLELRGPSNDSGIGISFGIQTEAPTKVNFVKVNETDLFVVRNGVLQLGTEPKMFAVHVDKGTLWVSISQKGTGSARSFNNILATVALELYRTQPGALALSAVQAEMMMADGTVRPIEIAVGKLSAQ